jgi:hypothetical protein
MSAMSSRPSGKALADALLASVDSLAYPERMALFAARARELAAQGDLGAVLAELRGRDVFEREVGLLLANVAGDTVAVLAYLRDADWRLRGRALRTLLAKAPAVLDAATLAEQLADAPAQARVTLYRALRAACLPDLADALVEDVLRDFGTAEAAVLLPACGADTVARLLPELEHQVRNWATLARRHTELVLRESARQLAELSGSARDTWWRRRGTGLLAVAGRAPEAVLDLLERYAPATYLPGDLRGYGALAAAHPQRVVALLTAPKRDAWLRGTRMSWAQRQRRIRLPRALLSRFARLDPAALAGIARALRDHEDLLAALLRAIAPSRRAELYDAAYAGVNRDQSWISPNLLDALPRSRRTAEARRILGLGVVREDAEMTLDCTACLDWAEGEPALLAAIDRAEPLERANGWQLLVECAARTGRAAPVTGAIVRLRRLRNEQDPVRSRALAALARVRPELIEPDAAEQLRQIVTDALQARDRSRATTKAVTDLAVAVLRHHFDAPPLLEFAQDALNRVIGAEWSPLLGSLDTRLRRGQEDELFTAVQPWLAAGMRRGRYEPLVLVAQALGRRARRVPRLQALLERAVRTANVSSVTQSAIELWLADPRHRSTRVAEVLAVDPSAVVLRPVWAAVSAVRTDLLDRVLTGPGPKGRFLPDEAPWVPPYTRGVQRWLPRQRRAYVDRLAAVADDSGANGEFRVAAIAAAARVGGPGRLLVEKYVASPNVNLAEAALGALAWTDQPAQALPVLLTYVDTDRARVATYAAGRTARYVAPSHLREALRPVALGTGKVTSRKEATRLLARFDPAGAGDLLHAVWLAPDQHRDVRVAVVSAARQWLGSPQAWQILTEAVAGNRYEVQELARARPLEVRSADRPRYAELVARACAHPDPEAARPAWDVLSLWTQWTPELTGLLVNRITDLAKNTLWLRACDVLSELVRDGAPGLAAMPGS